MYTDDQLLRMFLSPDMREYFLQKNSAITVEEIESRICELLKFLLMAEHCHGTILFSEAVDEIWHYWILQTRQYAELCACLPLRRVVHHSSADYPPTRGATMLTLGDDREIDRVFSFFSSYVTNFGRLTDKSLEYWPPAEKMMHFGNWSLEEFNDILMGKSHDLYQQN